jgi:phosphatidylglycerophosphatase A
VRWIATFFGVGFFKVAPGTMGSLASLAIWAPCVLLEISPWIRLLLVLAIFLLGWWATFRALPSFKSLDPKEIVIDEVAGQGLALVLCPPSWLGLLLGFILFRLLDILKPWPISYVDRKIKSALGVMLDDMVAGALAILIWLC